MQVIIFFLLSTICIKYTSKIWMMETLKDMLLKNMEA